jgi:hypothetical protein
VAAKIASVKNVVASDPSTVKVDAGFLTNHKGLKTVETIFNGTMDALARFQ